MKDLIAKLESATEGSRELDALIWQALGNPVPRRPDWPYHVPAPTWTTSIDAALSLVPEGWEWALEFNQNNDETAWVATCRMGDPMLFIEPEAATPALALCIAALKAREAQG